MERGHLFGSYNLYSFFPLGGTLSKRTHSVPRDMSDIYQPGDAHSIIVQANTHNSFSFSLPPARSLQCHPVRFLSSGIQRKHPLPCICPVDRNGFIPTPESIPPPNVSYRRKVPPGLPVYKHPLVRHFVSPTDTPCDRLPPESFGVSSSWSFDISRPHRHQPPRCRVPGMLHLFYLVCSQCFIS